MDTIFALASARGKAGVAIIRVSGPAAFKAALHFMDTLPHFHKAAVRRLHAANGTLIDKAMVLRFPEGASFTGEDTIEFQCHGSPAVIAVILKELSDLEGVRQSEPGEFTRRALENDRMNLAEIEGLGDLIEAETEAQRRQAMRVMDGRLGDQAEIWRKDLIRAMALLEATIDFADEDVPVDVSPEVAELLNRLLDSMRNELQGSVWAERVRDGFRVAILGAPNTGKSTLLNYLAGREVAITSNVAGTTRDILEIRLDVQGIPVQFQDTAGIRETEDVVETIGVSRARFAAKDADMRIFLQEDQASHLGIDPSSDDLVLLAKSDYGPGISGVTGNGVQKMLDHVVNVFGHRTASVGVAIKERHRIAIESASHQISTASHLLSTDIDATEIISEELRLAIVAVDSLVGRIDVEHVLGEIFSNFCIGK